jgi:nucleotide-binding universal stress UspA family protein
MDRSEILVGVDGSAESDAAVAWAVAEARARGCGLQILHACEARNYGLWTTTRTLGDGLRQMARPLIDAALALVARIDPQVPARGGVLVASASRTLIRLSEKAALIVIGRSGRGAISRLVLGSVTRHVLANACCPVVAVGIPPEGVTVGTVGRVVAEIGPLPTHEQTLRFAFTEARMRRAPLHVVHAVAPLPLPSARAGRELASSLIPWQARYPSVSLTSSVHVGDLDDAIASLGTPTDLLVLGQHRHGPLRPHALGGHTTSALHVAPCPVAVVHEPLEAPVSEQAPAAEPYRAGAVQDDPATAYRSSGATEYGSDVRG